MSLLDLVGPGLLCRQQTSAGWPRARSPVSWRREAFLSGGRGRLCQAPRQTFSGPRSPTPSQPACRACLSPPGRVRIRGSEGLSHSSELHTQRSQVRLTGSRSEAWEWWFSRPLLPSATHFTAEAPGSLSEAPAELQGWCWAGTSGLSRQQPGRVLRWPGCVPPPSQGSQLGPLLSAVPVDLPFWLGLHPTRWNLFQLAFCP